MFAGEVVQVFGESVGGLLAGLGAACAGLASLLNAVNALRAPVKPKGRKKSRRKAG